MALQESDLFIVQRASKSYKMAASELTNLIGEGVKPSPDQPTDPEAGDLWFDTNNNILYYYDGTNWQPITPEAPGTDEPENPTAGQLWYDTSVQALKAYVGGEWVYSIKGAEAGTSLPATGLEGQLFYHSTEDKLYVHDGSNWGELSGGGASVDVGETAPVDAEEGNLWWKSDEGILYIYYGPDDGGTSQWVQAAGSAGGGEAGANVTISPTAPSGAEEGDLWFNSDNGRLFIYYTGNVWVDASPAGQFNGGVVENAVTSPEQAIGASWDISTGCFWTCGAIDIPNPTNCVGGMTGTIRFTDTPTSWGSYFKFSDGTPIAPTAPAIVAFYVQDATNILVGKALNNYA